MANNPLQQLGRLGQAIWLDYIRRDLVQSGRLRRLIEEDGLCGLTSNPTIFEKAISESDEYDAAIDMLAHEGKSPREIFESIAQKDLRDAADLFRPLYERTDGLHGYVSYEVDPQLAHDTERTIDEALRLWRAIERPNLMIKVPGSREGLPAIRALIAEGINVNVTLLFGLPRYRAVTEAYLSGIEARLDSGKPVARVASVASFFLSRIDTLVDSKLEEIISRGGEPGQLAESLQGQVAVASAKAAYQIHKAVFEGESFRALAEKGARDQRLLWASTSTKNPAYSDVMYIDELVAPGTINTTPLETLEAYRDHGDPAIRIEEDVIRAAWVLEQLARLDIDLDAVTQQLEDEGVEKFRQPFEKLLALLTQRLPEHAGH